MGFTPIKSEDDIWMREKNGLYEYMDDLIIISNNTEEVYDMLVKKKQLKTERLGTN